MNCSLPTSPILLTPRRWALTITMATTLQLTSLLGRRRSSWGGARDHVGSQYGLTAIDCKSEQTLLSCQSAWPAMQPFGPGL